MVPNAQKYQVGESSRYKIRRREGSERESAFLSRISVHLWSASGLKAAAGEWLYLRGGKGGVEDHGGAYPV